VWLPTPLAERIDDPGELGRPGRRGAVVALTGIVERADAQDGGGVTLRATSMSTLAPAVTLDEPLHRPQAIVAGVMVGALIWWWLLASLASILRHRFTERALRWLNRLSGTAILGFGFYGLAALAWTLI
jgi:hypothetical protein